MALTRIDTQGMVQVCANCGAERRLDYSQLAAGNFNTLLQKPEPDQCPLPPCPQCEAVEFLIRTWDSHPEPQSLAGQHKRWVNRIFKELIDRRLMEDNCRPFYLEMPKQPPDILEGELPEA